MSTEPKDAVPGAPGATEGTSKESGLEAKVIEVLKTCFDPEIPVDIYQLGLIYDVSLKPEKAVHIKMTLTSPMCPVAESLPPEVVRKVKGLPEVASATVEVVWDPPWEPSMMSDAAKLQLNMM